MSYLFGDTGLAARRLELVARIYEEPTRDFLLAASATSPALALDLGCGPGWTTHLLARVLGCRRVVGLDSSESFIALARETETPKVTFRLHDVTVTPLPLKGPDLIFARLLVTHLREPGAVVTRWAAELPPGGRLLIEEPEWIRTGHAVIRKYLSLVEDALRSQSNDLYRGPLLDRLDFGPDVRKPYSQVRSWNVSSRDAATLFSMNLPNWKDDPFVRSRHSPDEIETLQAELETIARSDDPGPDNEWGLRQIAFERRAS
jgi:trans-aconitate methyltransferase